MAKKQTSLRIDSVLFEKITVHAKKENRSVNNMIERAAEVYLQDMGYKKPDVVGQSERFICRYCGKDTIEWSDGLCEDCALKGFN